MTKNGQIISLKCGSPSRPGERKEQQKILLFKLKGGSPRMGSGLSPCSGIGFSSKFFLSLKVHFLYSL